jgi:ketosteroid isomerase-like protein
MDPEVLMRSVAQAFSEGDLRPLLEAVDSDIVWKSGAALDSGLPFAGIYAKRSGVLEVTSRLGANYTFRTFAPRGVVTDRDIVWGLFDVEGSFLGGADRAHRIEHPFRLEMVIQWRLRNGKIVEHQSFFDTASLLMQQSRV